MCEYNNDVEAPIESLNLT